MHKIRQASAIVCAAVLAVGCHSATSAGGGGNGSSNSGGSGSGASGTTASYLSSLGTGMTTAQITDPSLNNIVAATLTIPSGWKLQGIEMISPCTFVPWPVFRAYSPDGLMQYRTEPVIGWKWRPNLRGLDNSGCANISSPVSASDFLQYYLGTLQGGVHVVGRAPVPAPYQQWAQHLADQSTQIGANSLLKSQFTADTAALSIDVMNGTIEVEERLRVAVECSLQNNAGAMTGGSCWARVDVLTAPLGKLDPLVKLVDGNNLPHGVNTQQWMQAAMARQQRQGQAALAALTAQEKQESQMLYQQFQQSMQRMQQEHQQFMQQQESQFQSAMANANASMNARSTAASDWVDYALDQQTVMNPDGSTTKLSNAYSQTWTNGTQWYQTNDPNANPNGVLSGNWSQTTQVHGNGAPK